MEKEKTAEVVPPFGKLLVKEIRILWDLRVSNGLHLRQGNLSYGGLKRLVKKLKWLC
ncbi:conserved domain protein [Paraprevotella xylaniphila YIT 11841]|uniref:Conserved domain protein n=1 Tax=Paraprevotella xylaniphila YIT 11841 TaxID=762982 RepID=F3QW37_9BACT|nr:hypothetical protein [Paraprevotella xylaniphila]EGG52306.1 conserved domain protein [Paraprevotella xylaniphila YIT 11841]